ncbi:MAG: nucleotidyl transferase AbiEii/AbiGii toxin family protein [Candidatus Auribacterota bacterium]|nr:nucleotidyl transferase AbiEii/AbiGii toxin family protein [Candidatus Auribacterota bacterium]
MIPENYIISWQQSAPWKDYSQIEQDLLISRTLIEIFSDRWLSRNLLFRGGTALYKLYFKEPVRYSEDLDFVMTEKGPVGDLFDTIRKKLDPVFKQSPVRLRKENSAVLKYRFISEFPPHSPRLIKIEINYSEINPVFKPVKIEYEMDNPWFGSKADICTYEFDELISTKLRALFQRKKGRDLFDLWMADERGLADPNRVIDSFNKYTDHLCPTISRARFEKNLSSKITNKDFRTDITPLLRAGQEYDIDAAVMIIHDKFIKKLAGEPYSGADNIFLR